MLERERALKDRRVERATEKARYMYVKPNHDKILKLT